MIDYEVRPGDTFYSIATAFGVTTDQLLSVNPEIVDINTIFVGQVIHIPEIYMRPIIEVNGYAFPDIDLHILEDTLPYLTYLSLYSYQVMPDGSLAGIDDKEQLGIISQLIEKIRFIRNKSGLAHGMQLDLSVTVSFQELETLNETTKQIVNEICRVFNNTPTLFDEGIIKVKTLKDLAADFEKISL